jgi:hypothetical protein
MQSGSPQAEESSVILSHPNRGLDGRHGFKRSWATRTNREVGQTRVHLTEHFPTQRDQRQSSMRFAGLPNVHEIPRYGQTARSVVAESVLMRHQVLVLNRGRKQAPNLRTRDRVIAGGTEQRANRRGR